MMEVNQVFSQTVLTTICSLQCPVSKITLTISFRPQSFFPTHTIRQSYQAANKMWLSVPVRLQVPQSFSSPGALNVTAKRKLQWKRSFKYYELPFNFVRLSLADLHRIFIRPSAGQSFICGALLQCMYRAPFHRQFPWRGNCEELSNMNSHFASVTADYANQFIEQTPTVLYKQLNKSQI